VKKDDLEEQKIKNILSKSIVVDEEQNDQLGKDMLEIAKEYTKPDNRFLFSQTSQLFIYEDSLLGAYAETIKDDPDLKDLYDFLTWFRFIYHTNRSAIKGEMRKDFTEFGSSILAFRGALAWREAGMNQNASDMKKENIMDKIKNR